MSWPTLPAARALRRSPGLPPGLLLALLLAVPAPARAAEPAGIRPESAGVSVEPSDASTAPPAGHAAPAAVSAAPPAPGGHWLVEPVPFAEGGALALAASTDGRIALGDARGVLLGHPGAWQRLPLRGGVRDLAFAPAGALGSVSGALWIASGEGLLQLVGTRLETHPPAPGDPARSALRVVAGARSLAVATEGGVFWSRDGRRFDRVEGALGDETPGLALQEPRDPAAPPTLWIAAARGLLRVRLRPGDGAQRLRAERADLPVDLRPALDVVAGEDGVVAVGRQELVAGDASGGRWRVVRPELPPGATPTRLLLQGRQLWLATDRGLLVAPAPEGPWRRAGDPAGTTPALALAATGGRLLAAGARGLLAETGPPPEPAAPARGEPPGGGRGAPAAGAGGCDPAIVEVQRAVLAHVDLGGRHVARMWEGVRRRALLPQVTLAGSWQSDDDHQHNWDQSYTYGELHPLLDRDRRRGQQREVSLALRWELGDLLYHDEEIDVSTEARRVIELRDDVLDEVNQLYFDRRRALAAAASAAPGSPEARAAEVRAEELAAGLDGWTGGWFGTRAGRAPCPPGSD
jgi:hypothetical protein